VRVPISDGENNEIKARVWFLFLETARLFSQANTSCKIMNPEGGEIVQTVKARFWPHVKRVKTSPLFVS
jgi:hypothetical protein